VTALLLLLAALSQDPAAAPEEPRWDWSVEAHVRAEAVRDIPEPTQRPFERVRARLLPGVELRPSPALTLGLRLVAAAGSDRNADAIRRFDNVRSDEVALDRLFVRWNPAPAVTLHAGRFALPLETTGLVWDPKLQAQGAAAELELPGAGPVFSSRLVAAASVRTHLHPDRSRLGALQWVAQTTGGDEVALGVLAFDRLESLIPAGLARTNRLTPDRSALVSDYRVASVLGRASRTLGAVALAGGVHLVRNLGADRHRDGYELRLVARDGGDRWGARYVFQHVRRDAVPAAFTDDVWWFHTGHRGHLAAVRCRVLRGLDVELGGVLQRRDDLTERLSRGFLDLRATW
jgi:hypothetical protein